MPEHQAPPFAQSVRWQTVNVMVQVVLQLAFMAVLARLITKSDFGVMAVALVVVGVVEIFAQVGIGPALIQRAELKPQHIATAATFSVALGLLFFGGMWVAAPGVAEWYEEPQLVGVLRVIALSFILSGLAVVPRSLLIRDMNFKGLFRAAVVAMVIGNLVIGLGLAWAGAGLWAYAGALLAQNALLGVGYWVQRPVSGMGRMDRGALREMLGYGGRSTLYNMANYAASKTDLVLVGRWTDWSTTGLYDRAAYVMGLPITVLGKLSDSVLFSGMSQLKANAEALRKTVLQATWLLATVVIPGATVLVLTAQEVLVIFLGEGYANGAGIAEILFAGIAFRALIKLGDAVVRATDALWLGLAIKISFLAMVAGGVYYALSTEWGTEGVAWAVTGATVVQFMAMTALVARETKWRWAEWGKAVVPGLLGGAVVVAVWAVCPCGNVIGTGAGAVGWFALAVWQPRILDGGHGESRKKWAQRIPIAWLNERWSR
jgi:O-antigen/teichoic acid export membrane protein